MKRLLLVLMMLLTILLPKADACIQIVHIGVINSVEGQLFSEMLAAIIDARTGTLVTTKYYKDAHDLYEAVKVKQVDIIVENTVSALQLLNKPADADLQKAYETVMLSYGKEKGLIWLKPFGFHPYTSPVVKMEILNTEPGLPRVLEKLAGIMNDETHAKLIKAVESGEKPRKVAKDFLRSKNLL